MNVIRATSTVGILRAYEVIESLVAQHVPGRDLPGRFYTDPEIFEHDLRTVYERAWIFVGHASEIPSVGDFRLIRIGHDEIILVRAAPSDMRAFVNICRHRGSSIVSNPCGSVREFVCPYHAWTYGLTGELQSAPLMPSHFDDSQYGLFQCHLSEIDGLLFLCLSSQPADFGSISDAITPFLAPHGLRDAKICRTLTQTIRANWKIVAANSWECYHCSPAHKVFSHVMPYSQLYISAAAQERYAAMHREWEMKHARTALQPVEPVDGGVVWAKRYPVRPGYVTQSLDGGAVAPLMGAFADYDGGVTGVQAFPAFWFSLCNDYALLTRILPLGPCTTEVTYYWLVNRDAREGVDFDPERVAAFWTVTAQEDMTLCETNQRGVESSRYLPGWLSAAEVDVGRFIAWYLQEVLIPVRDDDR